MRPENDNKTQGNFCHGRHPGSGFTLLELLVVMTLMGLLAALAVPTYQQYLQRNHRADAIQTLLATASCQQSIYAMEFRYDTRRCLPADPGGHYRFRIEPVDAASTSIFTVIASPLGVQVRDSCQELLLDQSGWRGISGPDQLQRKCWEGR
jgi:type IV pilus assembly protein PilE